VIRFSRADARRFLLAHQSLLPPRALNRDGLVPYVRKVGCIQYDPLDIVGRNADLVLNARIRNYRPSMLYSAAYERHELIDGWDKVMSIHLAEDFPRFRRHHAETSIGVRGINAEVTTMMSRVLGEIEDRGPLCSADLDDDSKQDWWWGPTRVGKAALDALQHEGSVVVSRRDGARKYFDLPHRVIGSKLSESPDPFRDADEYRAWRVERRIGSVGLGWRRKSNLWLGIADLPSPVLREVLDVLVDQGRLLEVEVSGEGPFYVRPGDLAVMDMPTPGRPAASVIAALDNLLWDRRLVEEFFGFTYVWEVYKPAAEREYGYYVLPILYGDRFVARIEAKRDDRVLRIIGWWWECERVTSTMQTALRRAVASLARMSGLIAVVVDEKLGNGLEFLVG